MDTKHSFLDEWLVRALKGNAAIPSQTVEEFRKLKKASVSEAVLEAGIFSREDLETLVNDIYSIPTVDIASQNIDRMVLSLLPEKVCRRYRLLPFQLKGEMLHVAMVNPLDADALGDIQAYSGRTPRSHFCLPTQLEEVFGLIFSPEFFLKDLLSRLENYLKDEGYDSFDPFLSDGDLDVNEAGSPIVKLVNLVIKKAIVMGASDIHIEHEENKSLVRFRIDGLLKNILLLPRELATGPLVARIKVMSNLDITDHFRPQDGRAFFRNKTTEIGFRISVLPTSYGEKIVMRLLDKRAAEIPFEKLGFCPDAEERIASSLTFDQGIILITGPTGSGKTTTLYSILNKLKDEHTNITTIEDPIEYKLEGINQVQVNDKQGLTFPTVIRSVLRQDPDIMLVGEIRDAETATIAIQAAMTGHLVFSTLHTNDAISTVERLRDIGIEPYKIASCLIAVTAQRLVRQLCSKCKKIHPSEQWETSIREALNRAGVTKPFYKAIGCAQCHFTGYKGQVPLLEFWELGQDDKKAISTGNFNSMLRQQAIEQKALRLLWKDAVWHAERGNTSLDEILPFLKELLTNNLEPSAPTVPVAPIIELKTISPSPTKEEQASDHILIVDDDPTIRSVYRAILENEGYRVSLAANGMEAVQALVKEKLDTVLLDLMMPEMGGFEVLKSIRQVMGLSHLPVIILTAVTDDNIMQEVLAMGADDYLVKPSSPKTVLNRVKSLIRRKIEDKNSIGLPQLVAGDSL